MALLNESITDVHFRFDGFSSPEPFKLCRRLVENDLYRYPLNDLDKVPGCILRREEREPTTGADLEAFNMCFKLTPGNRVDPDGNGLTNVHFL